MSIHSPKPGSTSACIALVLAVTMAGCSDTASRGRHPSPSDGSSGSGAGAPDRGDLVPNPRVSNNSPGTGSTSGVP
jgi:hypothetical protein